MQSSQDFKAMQDAIQAALIATTKSVSQLAAEDLTFQRSLNPEVGNALDEQGSRLLTLSNKLLASASSIADLRAPRLEDVEDIENNWRGVIDVVDSLLEKADASLDEYTGVIKRNASPAPDQSVPSRSTKKNPYSLGSSFRTQNLLKPQLAFQTVVDNGNSQPWKPLLKTKPHASVPLDKSLQLFKNEFDHQQYKHPYEPEIRRLQYPDETYQKAEPILYTPIETTTATFVDTYDGVLDMLSELKQAKEIAVDLEHHDVRSYVGLVSLMQISTRDKDWIVDTLQPWREDLQILNQVFADPSIIKVFHGAFMDIVWLQRDLGLYIVGLFDTHHACRVLGYQGGSLAFLLKKFVNFDADKKYQMADWRIRPLPEEMFFYARADTHYLLYIFDNLRNELIDASTAAAAGNDQLELVLKKSKEVSLLQYERQLYDAEGGKGPGGWFNALTKLPVLLSKEQFAVYRAVHEWRDRVARQDDDSTNHVMPNHIISSIAKVMPTTLHDLYGCVHPISHGVKTRIGELLETVKAAKLKGEAADAPTMLNFLKPNSMGAIAKTITRSPVNTPSIVTPILAPTEPMRTENSSFWGPAFGSSIWDPKANIKINSTIRLAIPLPPIAENAFSGTIDLAHRTQASPVEPIVTEPVKEIEEEAFVIKRGIMQGRKPKKNAGSSKAIKVTEEILSSNKLAPEEVMDTNADTVAFPTPVRPTKISEGKKAQKDTTDGATESGMDSVVEDEDEEEAFDYSKAESVLHAKRKANALEKNDRQRKKDKKGKKEAQPFDPYKKSEDTSTGMRRVQTERAGKSHTFRN